MNIIRKIHKQNLKDFCQWSLKSMCTYTFVDTHMYIYIYIIGTQLEHPFIKGGWSKTFQKLSHLGGVPSFLLERVDKPGKEGELMQKYGFFITLQFNHIYSVCGKSKVSFITFQFFNLLSQPCKILVQVFIVLKHCIICAFLVHSGSFQIMLKA